VSVTTTDPAALEPASEETRRYQRQKEFGNIASLVLGIVLLLVTGLGVGPLLVPFFHAVAGDSPWLRLIAVGAFYASVLELCTLPLDFWSGYILEHRYHLSNQSLVGWAWKRIKGYMIGGPFSLVMLLSLYALLWSAGPYWWLVAAVGWLVLTLILGQLVPVLILPLFYKVTRLEDTSLLDRLRHLADGTGLAIEGVYRLHLSAETRKANAALTGLGSTRRVLLGDTLLDNFSAEEIEVVFAHEVGHHVYRHLPKMIAASVGLTAVALWLADVVLKSTATQLGYPAFDDPTALPLLLLVLGVFTLGLMPVQNAVSRAFERQCDRYALRRTAKPEAYLSAFSKLARLNKADPDPHPVLVWLLHDHPPIRERLAMAAEVR
jgi:STE24 endopeptidase